MPTHRITTRDKFAELRGRAEAELRAAGTKTGRRGSKRGSQPHTGGRARKRRESHRTQDEAKPPGLDSQRLLHELQVHQVELEMQNIELQEAIARTEALLEKYTDLYDFAPVGHFSINEQGQILEANLTGAALLGVGRGALISRRLLSCVAPASRPAFVAFLKRVFTITGKHVCEIMVSKPDGGSFWANFHGTLALSMAEPRKWCRMAISDITPLKGAEEAQRRVETLSVTNRDLRREIVRRQAVERALKKSEHNSRRLLMRSHHMQEQLRSLSRQILSAQEEERKKISRELHDVIAQTLTGITVRLAILKKEAAVDTQGLDANIARTQKLVEQSVDIIHRFARELRPTVLDDLGLIPAVHSFIKNFTARTGIRTHLTASAAVERIDTAQRTTLYRVVQESLTNVARHAEATEAGVTIQKLDDAINMKIIDNGGGFIPSKVAHGKRSRLGLLGMKERLEMVHGTLEITSLPGQGTTIEARIPLSKKNAGVAVNGSFEPIKIQ